VRRRGSESNRPCQPKTPFQLKFPDIAEEYKRTGKWPACATEAAEKAGAVLHEEALVYGRAARAAVGLGPDASPAELVRAKEEADRSGEFLCAFGCGYRGEYAPVEQHEDACARNADRRVEIWDRVGLRKISGPECPRMSKLQPYLATRPDYALFAGQDDLPCARAAAGCDGRAGPQPAGVVGLRLCPGCAPKLDPFEHRARPEHYDEPGQAGSPESRAAFEPDATGMDELGYPCRFAHLGCLKALKNKESEASHVSKTCRYKPRPADPAARAERRPAGERVSRRLSGTEEELPKGEAAMLLEMSIKRRRDSEGEARESKRRREAQRGQAAAQALLLGLGIEPSDLTKAEAKRRQEAQRGQAAAQALLLGLGIKPSDLPKAATGLRGPYAVKPERRNRYGAAGVPQCKTCDAPAAPGSYGFCVPCRGRPPREREKAKKMAAAAAPMVAVTASAVKAPAMEEEVAAVRAAEEEAAAVKAAEEEAAAVKAEEEEAAAMNAAEEEAAAVKAEQKEAAAVKAEVSSKFATHRADPFVRKHLTHFYDNIR
jgi:hypothetical protein